MTEIQITSQVLRSWSDSNETYNVKSLNHTFTILFYLMSNGNANKIINNIFNGWPCENSAHDYK